MPPPNKTTHQNLLASNILICSCHGQGTRDSVFSLFIFEPFRYSCIRAKAVTAEAKSKAKG